MLLIAFLLLTIQGSALLGTHNPPISIYEPSDYQAGNQNWMIDQLPGNEIVVANGEGLLIFDGSHWKLFDAPQSLVVRSVRVINGTIYTGGYMDFGKWIKNGDGNYQYQSILRASPLDLRSDEQFWNILEVDGQILFQSLEQLYLYNPSNGNIISLETPGGVNKIFRIGLHIFYHSFNGNLYKLVRGEPEEYINSHDLPGSEIIRMFQTESGIRILFKDHGMYELRERKVIPWLTQDPGIFSLGDFYSATMLRNGDLALGTISRGIFIINHEGKTKYHLDQVNGLSNNTVLSLFEDRTQKLWLGLDNGINVIDLDTPFSEFIDKTGRLGTVYATIMFAGRLYAGTNQGLFSRSLNSEEEFSLVSNSNGQVWSLYEHDGRLFCGHNLGTFLVEENMFKRLGQELGTWKFEPVPGHPEYLLQGNYKGLHVLKKSGNEWVYSHPVRGTGLSMRQFVFSGGEVFVYHPNSGLLRFSMNSELDLVELEDTLMRPVTGNIASLVSLGEQVYFTDASGFYLINPGERRCRPVFLPGSILNWADPSVPTFVGDRENGFWIIFDNGLVKLSGTEGDSLICMNEVPLDQNLLKNKEEFENIAWVGDQKYLLGLSNGYLIIDFDRFRMQHDEHMVKITEVQIFSGKEESISVDLNTKGTFEFDQNNLHIRYIVSNVKKYQPVFFQYFLEGEMENWSGWEDQPEVTFHKLRPGEHVFRIRARVSNQNSANEASYHFRIRNVWYKTTYAYFTYLILLFLAGLSVNYSYRLYYRKRQQKVQLENEQELNLIKLKSDQELMRLRNEQLSSEIEMKNKELAATTMSLVKKNEFLISLRDVLHKGGSADQARIRSRVIDSINHEIENEESWEMLKDAFENVDKEFIKKIMNLHPNLTPNDLKLCTYLRLNLSTKEIASLMNISTRSMETKRYRLRKKMGLSHETNLVEYILSL